MRAELWLQNNTAGKLQIVQFSDRLGQWWTPLPDPQLRFDDFVGILLLPDHLATAYSQMSKVGFFCAPYLVSSPPPPSLIMRICPTLLVMQS